jgi:hypothetical protein
VTSEDECLELDATGHAAWLFTSQRPYQI